MISRMVYVARKTPIHRLDARTKLVFLITMTILCLLSSNGFYLLTLLIIVAVIMGMGEVLNNIKSYLKLLAGFSAFLFIIQAVFYAPPPGRSVTYLFHIPDSIPIIGGINLFSLQGVFFGVSMVLRLYIMVFSFIVVILTTSPRDLILSLTKLKVPYSLAFTIATAFRWVPTLDGYRQMVTEAQKSRAYVGLEAKGFREKIKAWLPLLIPLFLLSFEKAESMSLATETRALGAAVKRTYLYEITMRKNDWLFFMIFCIIASVLLYLLFFTNIFSFYGELT